MMRKKIAGFTLMELIVTLALAAIIVTVAVPAFQETIRRNRRATQANDFVSALSLARSEAIKRGDMVTICRSTDQTDCTAGANWEDGWLVFVDSNAAAGDTIGTLDDSEEPPLRVYEGLTGGNTLRVGATFQNFFSYLPNGLSRNNTGGFGADTFRLCDDQGTADARYIAINRTGRIQVRDYTAGDTGCP